MSGKMGSISCFSWDYVWAAFMKSSFTRSWLFNSEQPTTDEVMASLLNEPCLFGHTQTIADVIAPVQGIDVAVVCAPFKMNHDTVLGYCFEPNRTSYIFSFVSNDSTNTTKPNVINVCRCAWKRIFDENMNPYLLYIEFGWSCSGMLYVRTDVRPGDLSPNFNDSQTPFSIYCRTKYFPPKEAKFLSRACRLYDITNCSEMGTDSKRNEKHMKELFKPSFNATEIILTDITHGPRNLNLMNMSDLSITQPNENNSQLSRQGKNINIWHRISDKLTRVMKTGKLEVSIKLSDVDKNSCTLSMLPTSFILDYHYNMASNLKVSGKINYICSMLGIQTYSSPVVDRLLLPSREESVDSSNKNVRQGIDRWQGRVRQCSNITQFNTAAALRNNKITNVDVGLNGTVSENHIMVKEINQMAYLDVEKDKFKDVREPSSLPDQENSFLGSVIDANASLLIEPDNAQMIEPVNNQSLVENPSTPENADTIWKCDQCDKVIKGKKSNLQRHVLYVHLKHQKYACTIPGCKKNFQSRSNLQRHMTSVHVGRMYACQMCTRRFRKSVSLEKHMSSVHSRRNYTCDKCGGKFQRDYIVRRHKLTCQGKTTYLDILQQYPEDVDSNRDLSVKTNPKNIEW